MADSTDTTDTSDLLDTIGKLANAGAQVYQTATGGAQPTTAKDVIKGAPAVTAAAQSSGWKQYLPWIIGGAVLLVLVLGFTMFRRK